MQTFHTETMRSERPPNILFIFTDDQRFDTIHALGNRQIVTPNMDALVRDGVAFTHAGIMGSTMPAVCCPSRAMMLSGRSLYHAPDDLEGTLTFPEMLRAVGYTTFGTGKWHNQPASFARSFCAGGSIFFGGMSDHFKVPVHDFDPTGGYIPDRQYIGGKFSSELFTDTAVDFLRGYESDQPFLLYFSSTAPHDPRTPPKSYEAMYDPGYIPVPNNFMPRHPFDNGEMTVRDEKLASWPRTPDTIRRHIADYYAMITHLDQQIGRILEALRDTGQAENTIIVFAGDNGLALGQHGLMGKQSLYDHSIRVPLIMSGPGIPQGETRDTLCYLYDIFPTLCDLIGMDTPGSVEGKSLLPAISGEQAQVRDSMFLAYRDVQRAVREERYKLIEYSVDGVRTTQLFDLDHDTWEMHNLAQDAGHSEQLERMRQRLAQWQDELDDPLAGKFAT